MAALVRQAVSLQTTAGFVRECPQKEDSSGQDQTLQQSSHMGVVIGKEMDEFEFVVKDGSGDERINSGDIQPNRSPINWGTRSA